MISGIAAWLIGKGVSEKFARPLIFAVIGAVAVASVIGGYLLWLSNHDANVIEAHETGVQLDLERGARRADQNVILREKQRELSRREARKEFDNATAHLPPEGLTRRQRIDLCIELREGGVDTAPIPECRDVPAGTETGAFHLDFIEQRRRAIEAASARQGRVGTARLGPGQRLVFVVRGSGYRRPAVHPV